MPSRTVRLRAEDNQESMTSDNKKEVSIFTLNIRRDRRDDGINNWEFRKHLVADLLSKYQPDVAVFQEVLVHQLRDLIAMLPGYSWIGVGRDDGEEAGEFAPIFYRGMNATQHGTFWMSDTPDVPSQSWPGMTRICTWTQFDAHSAFAVFNTHLEYQFEETQLKSIDLIRERAGRLPPDYPVLLAGDFNFTPGTAPYIALARDFHDSHGQTQTEHPGGSVTTSATCHQFTGRTEVDDAGAQRIDYIWSCGNVRINDYRILTDGADNPAGVFVSDHWPVMCKVAI